MTATAPHPRRSVAAKCPAYHFFDSLMIVHTDGSDGGPIIMQAIVAPGGGAPTHVHADLDDSFYLLSGRVAVRCGDDTFLTEPGDFVAMPHGVPHTFRVVGDQPAKMLQIHADDSFLRFVRTVGTPTTDRALPPEPHPMDFDRAFQVAAETGQPVIGPPMSAEDSEGILAASP
jgi:mannose-6-phosphate isomerase-like protein (cupin superfamily)